MFQLILFALLFGLFVYRRMKQMSILERSGIPGPKPNLITGNLIDYFFKPNVVVKLSEYREKYGKIFGYYLGGQAVVNVLDLDLIQQIQIKNFSQFSTRIPNLSSEQVIFFNQDVDIWKANRTILSGAYNGAKLKSMVPLINSSLNVLMNKVEEEAKLGSEFNIYDHFKPLAVDVMSKTTLGIDGNFQNNPKAAQQMFSNGPIDMVSYYASSPTLSITKIGYMFSGYQKNAVNKFVSNAIDSLSKLSSSDKKENSMIQSIHGKMARGASVENAEYFVIVGSHLTSSALTFVMHFLVNHPEIQNKARKEVLELTTDSDKFDHESMSKLTYMQAVINETLRFYPPLTNFATRSSFEDFYYKDIVLPKNSLVQVPLYQLHHTEEYWPKHDQFNPDRFLDKSNLNSVAFQPFGAGPRMCLGARFAMLEMKLTLAQLLSKYEFVPGPSTEKELTLKYSPVKEAPANGVWLKAVPLN